MIRPSPTKPALLLAAHGTRDQAGVAAFRALAERVGGLAGADGTRVAGGFIELSAPPLRDAVAALVNGTPAQLVAVPLMLSAAGHAKGDIPAALDRERARHPGLRWAYARPLGPHPLLIDLLAQRVDAEGADTPAVLVVGRGSTDPDANADVVKTTRLLWEGRDYPLAETAFVSLARPELDIACAGVLGDCDEIAALVYERYHEALSGDIRMNCDMCVYRIAMPGFEHRVGEPQHPHDHPHDSARSPVHG